jgi:IPT/TIG domain-containing protein
MIGRMEVLLPMKPLWVGILVSTALLVLAQQMPRMVSVEPDTGKAGTECTVNGESLAKSAVSKLYLTDGKNDVEVEVVSQEDKAIKFKIPGQAKAGRWALMVLTAGKEGRLIEQPVKVTVE